jgi:hypothetical protein
MGNLCNFGSMGVKNKNKQKFRPLRVKDVGH